MVIDVRGKSDAVLTGELVRIVPLAYAVLSHAYILWSESDELMH
jgi:hypothetical protein